MPEEKCKVDKKFEFETTIGSNDGQLNISFKFVFESDLKLNTEAPQRWSLSQIPSSWSALNLNGTLENPIHVQYSQGKEKQEISIFLNIVACKTTECIPMKIMILYHVHRDENQSSNNCDKKIVDILHL